MIFISNLSLLSKLIRQIIHIQKGMWESLVYHQSECQSKTYAITGLSRNLLSIACELVLELLSNRIEGPFKCNLLPFYLGWCVERFHALRQPTHLDGLPIYYCWGVRFPMVLPTCVSVMGIVLVTSSNCYEISSILCRISLL